MQTSNGVPLVDSPSNRKALVSIHQFYRYVYLPPIKSSAAGKGWQGVLPMTYEKASLIFKETRERTNLQLQHMLRIGIGAINPRLIARITRPVRQKDRLLQNLEDIFCA
ncbi:hypothetical protein R1flu_003314 [Riccia fluitans]|uniref:Integrase n=1 Tax=Riccia fluitans TaxID=41844 RepID=A0ABD1Y9M1_9MARC